MIVFAAAIPFSVSAYQSLGIHQDALERSSSEMHEASARFAAAIVSDRMGHSLETARGLVRESVDWPSLTESERSGALWLIYSQVKLGAIVSLLDAQGRGLGPSTYLNERSSDYPDRPAMVTSGLSAFAKHLPHEAALGSDEVLGEIYESDGQTMLPVAFGVSGRNGERWVLAVGLMLNALCDELASIGGPQRLSLYDERQRSICAEGVRTPLISAPPGLGEFLNGAGSSFKYELSTEGRSEWMLAADSPTFSAWHVVAQRLASAVNAPSERMRLRSLLWLAAGVIGALVGGLILAQSILKPLSQLSVGARRAAEGDFEFKLDAQETDELGQLARSFDYMMNEVRKRDQEIRTWNQELQARVDERTRELRAANDALLESRTIAAMASLGAGVAHEINNPLTGVLGMTQVLLARARKSAAGGDVGALESIEKEAKRIQELVRKLTQLTQARGEGMLEVSGRQLLQAALAAERGRSLSVEIQVVQDFSVGASNVVGNPYQLTELFHRVIDNAYRAMAQTGGTLTVGSRKVDAAWTEFSVEDTGHGIREEHKDRVFEPFFTTKDAWRGEGLGLTLAYRIVEVHGGKIEVHSEWQKGTRVVVRLPSARVGALLA
jgi:signal transduction histidine kinase